jgi:hypothetical protein
MRDGDGRFTCTYIDKIDETNFRKLSTDRHQTIDQSLSASIDSLYVVNGS